MSCLDVEEWDPSPCNLISVDFNSFTLKRSDRWKGTLRRLSSLCHYLLIADSACYGFRMGNLQSYGVASPLAYYQLLEREMRLPGKWLTRFCSFGNAALVMWEDRKREMEEVQEMRCEVSHFPSLSLGVF